VAALEELGDLSQRCFATTVADALRGRRLAKPLAGMAFAAEVRKALAVPPRRRAQAARLIIRTNFTAGAGETGNRARPRKKSLQRESDADDREDHEPVSCPSTASKSSMPG
jgi:hypothetical protein